MLIPVLLFTLGLLLLIKGGDWFVDGATAIAKRFHVPEILIGATVVSIGTTLPEVMVSATSAVSGHGEIAYGNAIGSIICNTALIAALTITIRPSKVDSKTLRMPVVFFFTAAAIYAFAAYFLGTYNRLTGLILLGIFVLYMFLAIKQALDDQELQIALEFDDIQEEKTQQVNGLKDVFFLIVGAALIAFGANLLVENGTLIAKGFGLPESVIALTFVALGTSLPELVTAITSLIKGHGALSLGNVIGANMFNLVLVSGISISFAPFDVPAQKLIGGMNSSLIIDIPLMILVMAFLTLPVLKTGQLKRYQGISLLTVYAAFCVYQFL